MTEGYSHQRTWTRTSLTQRLFSNEILFIPETDQKYKLADPAQGLSLGYIINGYQQPNISLHKEQQLALCDL